MKYSKTQREGRLFKISKRSGKSKVHFEALINSKKPQETSQTNSANTVEIFIG